VAKLQVDVDLLPVAKDLAARAGDRLMVLGGMVVGVYTGRAPEPEAKDRSPAQQASIRNALAARWAKPRQRRAALSEKQRQVREAMLQALREAGINGPVPVGDLYRWMGPAGAKTTGHSNYARAMARRSLERDGLLRVEGEGYGMTVELLEPPKPAAAPNGAAAPDGQ
jgi:hypothetical protein